MEKTYTYNALVQFLYREMPGEEAIEMVALLEVDSELRAAFEDLMFTKTKLPKVQFHPSSAVLNRVLQYSTHTALEAHL